MEIAAYSIISKTMQSLRLQNVAGNRITVTTTATLLLSLIDTAGGGAQNLPANLDAINIYVEDGNVRMLSDGNSPTASIGLLLKKGALYQLRGYNLNFLKLISAGTSNVVLNIEVGLSNEDETSGGMGVSTTGGVFNVVDPSLTNGQSTEFQFNSRGDLKVFNNTRVAGEDLTNNAQISETQMNSTNITASALIATGAGRIAGYQVNSCSAGATVQLFDQTSAAAPAIGGAHTYTAAVNQGPVNVPVPGQAGRFNTGLYVAITGTANVTVWWRQTV